MNTNDYTIRLEKPEDYREVENLVRESFWNVYRPGCSEHRFHTDEQIQFLDDWIRRKEKEWT